MLVRKKLKRQTMDLGAFVNIDSMKKYVVSNYGDVPRLRGIRLMRVEEKTGEGGRQMDLFDSMCGKDIVYIHTRCGSYQYGDDDPDANYMACGGMEFDRRNADRLIASINDEFDGTYRDHYFHAVVDDEYERLIEGIGAKVVGE